MSYELVDLATGDVVRADASEAAARRDVAATIRRLGPKAIADPALGGSDHPPGGAVLVGRQLVERALAGRARAAVLRCPAAAPPFARRAGSTAGRLDGRRGTTADLTEHRLCQVHPR